MYLRQISANAFEFAACEGRISEGDEAGIRKPEIRNTAFAERYKRNVLDGLAALKAAERIVQITEQTTNIIPLRRLAD